MKNDEVILYDPEVGTRSSNRQYYIDYTEYSRVIPEQLKDLISEAAKMVKHLFKGVTMPDSLLMQDLFHIEKIIVNGPATIVFFGPLYHRPEKIVVKRQEGDEPNLEKAILMAMVKRLLGNKYGIIGQSLKKYPDDPELAVTYALLRKNLKGYEIRDLVKQGKNVLVDQSKQ